MSTESLNGLLVIDKPEGMTSHDVVDRVRRLTRQRRIGHCGTLDPFATGVLVLLLGKATRLQRFLIENEKVYRARIRLGYPTDTQDRTGKLLSVPGASKPVVGERILGTLESFKGEQTQLAPMYSAKKLAGQRLYVRARRGEEVAREPHVIQIHDLQLMPIKGVPLQYNADGTMDLDLEVTCSAGTYIRTLAHDFGERLGCGGHLFELRRLRSGPFTLEKAVTLQALEDSRDWKSVERNLIAVDELDLGMPEVQVTAQEATSIRHGRPIPSEGRLMAGVCRLTASHGRLLAVGEAIDGGRGIQPRVVLD